MKPKTKHKRIQRAKERYEDWDPRGNLCPICGKDFRHGNCSHDVKQARDVLFERYIKEVAG